MNWAGVACVAWLGAGLAAAAAPPGEGAGPVFDEVADAAGVSFHHFNGATGKLYMAEIYGPGAALFDLEGDGDLDLFVAQGQVLDPSGDASSALDPPHYPLPLTDRLYRNDLVPPPGQPSSGLHFTDVTESSGLATCGYGNGVAAGDYDNDGRTDLYVASLGANRLLHNDGGGRLTDVTERSASDDPRWSVAAAFFDYDRDGWLDLWVVNYLDFNVASHKYCTGPTGTRDYCDPTAFRPVRDRLLRNRGDGTFEDVSTAAGIDAEGRAGMGVVTADFDGDGWIDVYVTNDGMANQLFMNRGDGTFREDGLLAGCAVNAEGAAEASMGVTAGDFDGDGDEDLFVTHLIRETNTLYRNEGGGFFSDATESLGLGTPSWGVTTFGTQFVDYDNDGRLDLVAASGGVTFFASGVQHDLGMPNQLFHNLGDRFSEVSRTAGASFDRTEVSRGLASGDLDNDGDTDLVVLTNAGPVRMLINREGSSRAWIGLRLVGEAGRDALGARVDLLAGDQVLGMRRVRSDGSYASASDPRVLFGLGEHPSGSLGARVTWPDGRVETFEGLVPGRYTELRRGESSEP
jgi:enediyne biosynthesis protein E4